MLVAQPSVGGGEYIGQFKELKCTRNTRCIIIEYWHYYNVFIKLFVEFTFFEKSSVLLMQSRMSYGRN